MKAPIRIANCSGFLGDRPSGAAEMVNDGPIDVLTGDWLAELTMLILSRIRAKRPGAGYARLFVDQMEQVMGTCLDRGIKVVSNAGGLDPANCADAVAQVAGKLGLAPRIAYVTGDDLMERLTELVAAGDLQPFDADGVAFGEPSAFVTANAYLGCWGIVDALAGGADIVITGRVTDAAVVCGPAAWHHGWSRHDFDQLAGAVVAGHLIECSGQVTGGNYSFFHEIEGSADPVRSRFGFPWAEIAADGSCVIGKHDGTGGAVTVGTVTSQVLYEIGGPEYFGPDVTARFDTITLDQIGVDRVRVSGVRGQAPPSTLKVAMNEHGGYRNSVAVALTGLDIEAKAAFAEASFWNAYPYLSSDIASVTSRVVRSDKVDPNTQEEATAVWRLTVKDPDERKVGRAFADAMVQTTLAGQPGMYSLGGAPTGASAYGVYRPALIDAALVPQYVHMPDGSIVMVDSVAPTGAPTGAPLNTTPPPPAGWSFGGPTVRAPLGRVVGTRSGDKGGNANLGVYVRNPRAWPWLDQELTVERLCLLLPEASGLRIDRYRFPNLLSLNFVLHGLLDEGVAASTRQDAQAKALGEWLRARLVEIPESLLNAGTPSSA